MDIDQVNRMTLREFVDVFGGIFEHAPWVAERACLSRPFASVYEMHRKMMDVVRRCDESEKVGLLRGHPELGGREARAGEMTPDSSSEQSRLGLDRLSEAEFSEMTELNRLYDEKFGFPCMICLRLHVKRDTVVAEHRRRLLNDRQTEIENCIEQVGQITERRLRERVRESQRTRRAISTHVLDSGNAGGAQGMVIELQRFEGGGYTTVARVTTDEVGRAQLLDAEEMRPGRYQMILQAGAYLAEHGTPSTFIDVIPVLFEVDDPYQNYHIPLIVGRYAFSVYKGGIPALASGPTREDVR
ncbi:2-oxo-4-hydroxy-4-carboxy-5-ureidoimidazoline decarboxylase [Aminobacter sp. P9b]